MFPLAYVYLQDSGGGYRFYHGTPRGYVTSWNLEQIQIGLCCDEEELEIIDHLFCNRLALSKLRLKTLNRGFFEGLNSVSGADMRALHRLISSLR